MTVTLVPRGADTAVLKITAKGGPTLTYRYGTREGRFAFTAAKPKLKAGGDDSTVGVTAVSRGRRVTAQFEVVAEHVRTKTATATLELTAIAPRALARGCAPGTTASVRLTNAAGGDTARLTARGKCAFLAGGFTNGQAKVSVSP